MACGAADAVRGVASPLEELRHIVEHSQSTGIIVQDAACLEKLLPVLRSCAAGSDAVHAALRFVVLLWGDVPADAVASAELPFPVLTFDQVMERGEASPVPFTPPAAAASDDLATLVYTSGTTGHPKGVMLTHSNILYQVENLSAFLRVHPGERTLSLLPPWHIYERTCCYYILSRGAAQVYSNIRSFRDDLGKFLPDHLVCVPLVLDTLRSRVFATLKQASAVRRALAMALLSVAVAYVRARRVVEGMDQRFAVTPRPALELAKAWLVSVLLKPFNW